VNVPPFFDFFEAEEFVTEELGQQDAIAQPLEDAICAYANRLDPGFVGRVTWCLRKAALRGYVCGCRRFLAMGLVGTYLVEVGSPDVEAPLLSEAVSFWRRRSFGLQCSVHSFMAAVLGGLPLVDPLRSHTEFDEPDGQHR
jgi:hypothetical protein